MTPHYHVNIFWRDEDECWIADVPDLKACSGLGDTPDEALREAQVAMASWLEVAAERGFPIPEATYRPAEIALRSAA